MLRMVPLPRFAREDEAATFILPHEMGEGDRPQGGGGGAPFSAIYLGRISRTGAAHSRPAS